MLYLRVNDMFMFNSFSLLEGLSDELYPFVFIGFQLILGEEVALSKLTLFDITQQICDAVQARAAQGTHSTLSCCI